MIHPKMFVTWALMHVKNPTLMKCIWCNKVSFIVLILTYMCQLLFCQSQLFNLFEQLNLKLKFI
jgi:hypothetical protein